MLLLKNVLVRQLFISILKNIFVADYANFGDEDILAQVIAQSQQEYINSFRPRPPSDQGSPRPPTSADS